MTPLRTYLRFLILFASFTMTAAAQADDSWKVFSDSSVARIDITIDPVRLQWIFNNAQSDSEHPASVRFRNAWIDDTADSIGFRLRGNTSRNAKKKSFKVSFNSFIKGRKFHGMEKLNLNGEHNDPSIIRSKLSFDLYRDMGITASRTSHARVYINGSYYGLYVSVEHVDEEFLKRNFADDSGNLWKCLYPADLKYLGSDPNLYKTVMHTPERAYELTTNEGTDDYSALGRFISIVNTTDIALLPDSLEKVFDVRRFLQYCAVNTLTGSWDDYRSLMNNYYLYHIPSRDRLTLIPYDYDNTFGVDWFSVNWATADPYAYPKAVQGSRPLWDRMITVPQYRDLYTHFLRFYADRVFALPHWEARLDRLKDSITGAAIEDQFRTLDYGFTITDFHASFSSGPFSRLHVKSGIKQFVTTRTASLMPQLTSANSLPMVYQYSISPERPSAVDSITITASAFAAAGLREMWIYFTPEGASSAQSLPMHRTSIPGTQRVEDADRWSGTLPPLGANGKGTFRIIAFDSLNRSQGFPRSGSVPVRAGGTAPTLVLINEFMADNTAIPDPAGQFDDWVELYNPTNSPVTLTGKYLSDKATALTKWRFTQPDLTIPPGGYLIVWCDEELQQQGIHAGIKLSAGGEYIALTDSDGVTVLDSLSFGPQTANISFGRIPNGGPGWGSMTPTPAAANSTPSAVSNSSQLPRSFDVQVFPNPFNPSTTISITVPERSLFIAEIFDTMGRLIWSRNAGRVNAGSITMTWNGTANNGSTAVSGTYFLRVRLGNEQRMQRLLLMK